jgi:hypothetical protein
MLIMMICPRVIQKNEVNSVSMPISGRGRRRRWRHTDREQDTDRA